MERTVARRDSNNYLIEMGKDVSNVVYEVGKFVGGNFVMPTWFRNPKDEVLGGIQIILGFGGLFINGLNLAMVLSGENNYPDMLAVPYALWLTTNIASIGYEWYRSAKNRVNNKGYVPSQFSDEEIDSLSVDELAERYNQL